MSELFLIRNAALTGFNELVHSFGGSGEALLTECGLPNTLLEDSETLIPYAKMINLLEVTAKRVSCPNFGLLLAENQTIDMLGALGKLMLTCETIRDALSIAQHSLDSHNTGEYWLFKELDSVVLIERYDIFQGINHAVQHKELSLCVAFFIIKNFLPHQIAIDRIEFSHAPTSDLSFYKQHLNCEVKFNQECERIVVNKKALDLSIHLNQPHKAHLQIEHSTLHLPENKSSLERRVRIQILKGLEDKEVTIDHVANTLAMNVRTLQRQLKKEGVSFNRLLIEARMNIACWFLTTSDIDITALSQRLGYTHINAFSKAFRHNKGISPFQWRKANKLN